MKKAVWNSLPARREDVARLATLIGREPVRLSVLLRDSGLSKTRCLCALDALLAAKRVEEVRANEFVALGSDG